MKKYAYIIVGVTVGLAAVPLLQITIKSNTKLAGPINIQAQGGSACCQSPLASTVTLAGSCGFHGDYFLYQPVNTLPLDPMNDTLITALNTNSNTHRLGSDPAFFLNTATNSTTAPSFQWDTAGYEGDGGTYRWLPTFIVESYPAVDIVSGGGTYIGTDAHVLVLNTDTCLLYETYNLQNSTPPYHNSNGAIFDLDDEKLRYAYKLSDPKIDTAGLTSGDVSGMTITPLVLKHSEISSPILHALRVTFRQAEQIGNGFVWPAAHGASVNTTSQLFMGTTFRLKSTYDPTGCTGGNAFPSVVTALKTYGAYLADFGIDGLISMDNDAAWGSGDGSDLDLITTQFHCIGLTNLEIVDNMPRIISKFSGQVKLSWPTR